MHLIALPQRHLIHRFRLILERNSMSLFKHLTPYTLAGCLISAAANVIAAPVAFTQSEYTTFASVDMGADTSGLLSKSSPPDMLPLLSSAILADAGNSSLATGSANTWQFDVNTDTVSSGLFAAATAGAATRCPSGAQGN